MAKKNKDPVNRRMNDLMELREERNALYSDAHLRKGAVLLALYGGTIPELTTEEDLNRFGLLNMMVSKMIRYAVLFDQGGHEDSLDDLSIMSQMLNEIDAGLEE